MSTMEEITKGLSQTNMSTLARVSRGVGAGKGPGRMQRMEYADAKNALRGSGPARGRSVQRLKGEMSQLTAKPVSKGVPKGMLKLVAANTSARGGRPLLNQSKKAEYAHARLEAHNQGKLAAGARGPNDVMHNQSATRGLRARNLSRIYANDLTRRS